MPILESKKTGLQSNVSLETWNEIKEKGWHRRFIMIDDSDLSRTVAKTPIAIHDFMDKEGIKLEQEGIEKISLEDYTIKQLKEMLDKKGIVYKDKQKKQYYIDLF